MVPAEYGKTALILTLISLVPIADFGLTNVYSRKVPPLLNIGQADEVKRLFCLNATSLGRHEFYQGAGLLDLMRVLSNV